MLIRLSSGWYPGRPKKSFVDSSERSKRRKTEDLRSIDAQELTYAAQMKLRSSGQVDTTHVIKDLTKSPTMVDAKVCNAASQTTSTMRCYICGATSRTFNDLSKKRDVNKDTLRFGLSILHARIRFFKTILHLCYKLPIKNGKLDQKLTKK